MLLFKKTISLIIRVGVSIVLLFLLFKFQNIDLPELLLNIRQADKFLLTITFAISFLNYLFCFYRWKMLLDVSEIRPPLKKIITSFAGGIFFNSFLPSTIGGDVVRSLDLSVHTQKPKEVIATVLLDRLSGYVGLVLLVLVSLLFGWRFVYNNPAVLWSIAIIVLVLILILLVLFNNLLFFKINRLMHSPRAGRVREALKNLHEEMHYFKNHKKVLVKNLILSLLVQAIFPITSYLIALSLGVRVSVIYFFVIVPIIGAITLLPIAIGGLGLREHMFVIFFRQAAVKDNISAAVSLLGFGFVVIYAAIGGIVYVLTLRHRRLQYHTSSGVQENSR